MALEIWDKSVSNGFFQPHTPKSDTVTTTKNLKKDPEVEAYCSIT